MQPGNGLAFIIFARLMLETTSGRRLMLKLVNQIANDFMFYLSAGLQDAFSSVLARYCVHKKAVSPKTLIRCRIYFSPVSGFSTCRIHKAYSLKSKAETALGAFILRVRIICPVLLLWSLNVDYTPPPSTEYPLCVHLFPSPPYNSCTRANNHFPSKTD